MNFEYIKYKEITFPIRNCEFSNGKSTIRRKIGSEVMSDFLFSGNGGTYLDEEAEQIDSTIAYFVPHDLIINGSDQEILDYIYYHIESDIYNDFN